jgi:hypothetical protein
MNSLESDLPTEEGINEWTRKSRNQGKCGIVNCNNPTKLCKKCINYYCQGHFPSHLDLLPINELEYGSNEGLD